MSPSPECQLTRRNPRRTCSEGISGSRRFAFLTVPNTSVWRTRPEAMAMSSLPEMRHLRDTFEQLGVTFEPVADHDMLWEIFTLPT